MLLRPSHKWMMIPFAVVAALLAVVTLARAGFADDRLQDRMEHLAGSKSPVVIEADKVEYDRKDGTFTAEGSVVISQGRAVLTAERATLNELTGEAQAMGDARLTDDGNVLEAESISVNFDTKLGVIDKGRIYVKRENYHITGRSLMRVSENEYHATGASLTTCDGGSPFWRVSASELKVRMDKDVRAKNAVLAIKGLPVLYSPYAWFPLLKPRTTGFLIPSVGYSTDDGSRIYESFYWAPADNFDATLNLDFRSKRGLGVGADLRWAADRDTSTFLSGYYMDDRKDNRERYRVSLRHQQSLFLGLLARADVNLSERQYFRELSETAKDRTQRSIDSNVFVTRPWDWGEAYVFSQYTLGLDLNSDFIVQRAPEAGFSVIKKQLFDSPFYLDMDGSASYFIRDKGVVGARLDLYPKLSAAFNLGGLNISPRVGYRQTSYELSGDNKEMFSSERGLLGAGVTAQTGFSKLYKVGGDMVEGVRHTLEPMAAYSFVEKRGGSDFTNFDGVDTFGRRNMVAYSLINRFVIKYAGKEGGRQAARVDFLTVKLSQFYDLYGDTVLAGTRRSLSSLYGETVYKAGDILTVTNNFRYSFYSSTMLSVNTDVRFDDSDRRWYLKVGQRFSSDTDQTFISPSRFDFFTPSTDFLSDFVVDSAAEADRVNFLSAGAGVKLWDSWEASAGVWYDLHSDSFRENSFSLSYSSQCWGIGAHYIKRPGERQVMVTISLKGLGGVKI